MRNIKVVLEYEGTAYSGFQVQANANTVQEQIEAALQKLTKEQIRIVASGRTDAGVHAMGQVINFFTNSNIPAEKFAPALNTWLPKDIRALESSEEDQNFHARFSAKWKTYRYLILNREAPSALLRNLAHWVPDKLDIALMRLGACELVGTHDFRAFMASGSSVVTTVRTVTESEIRTLESEDLIEFRITADGFLYNMVRIIVGTLIEIGRGKLDPSVIKRMLDTGDRSLGGPTAPAKGLYLVRVTY